MGGRYLVSGAHAHTGTLLLTRSPDTTRTRRGALKHLLGDRPESVPRPQRAQHTHIGARGGGPRHPALSAPQAPLLWRAQRAIFFRNRLHKAFSCGFWRTQGCQCCGCARRANACGLQAAGLVQAHHRRAQRPKIFEVALLKGISCCTQAHADQYGTATRVHLFGATTKARHR